VCMLPRRVCVSAAADSVVLDPSLGQEGARGFGSDEAERRESAAGAVG
jgi:hypothetical protein